MDLLLAAGGVRKAGGARTEALERTYCIPVVGWIATWKISWLAAVCVTAFAKYLAPLSHVHAAIRSSAEYLHDIAND